MLRQWNGQVRRIIKEIICWKWRHHRRRSWYAWYRVLVIPFYRSLILCVENLFRRPAVWTATIIQLLIRKAQTSDAHFCILQLSTSKNEIRFGRTMSSRDIAFIVGNSVEMSLSHLFLQRTRMLRRIYKSDANFGSRFVANSFYIEIWSLGDCDLVHHKQNVWWTSPKLCESCWPESSSRI